MVVAVVAEITPCRWLLGVFLAPDEARALLTQYSARSSFRCVSWLIRAWRPEVTPAKVRQWRLRIGWILIRCSIPSPHPVRRFPILRHVQSRLVITADVLAFSDEIVPM